MREMVRRHCRLAARIADDLVKEPGLHILNEIHSNQVAIVCGDGDHTDQQTGQVLQHVQERGKVYPTHGEWKGRKIIRASVIGYAMEDEHADLLVSEIVAAWRQVQDEAR